VDGSVSSQFVTALLLVAPFLAEGLTLNLEGNQVSATYVSMTLALLQRMGVPVERRGTRIRVEPFVVTFTDAEVESDWSSAAFFFEAACMAREAELELNRLTEDSIQGDARLKDLAALFGLEGRFTCSGWNIGKSGVGQSQLDLNLCGEPDLFPALCAGAAGSGIKARFTGLGHLRIKESDRLLAMEENLLLLGADCAIYDDGFLLRRSDTLRTDGVLLNGFSDHRIVMALAVMAVRCGFVRITDAEQVAKSFPGFWDELRKLGFDVHLVP
jgi:3-phosphoshikimate 1-carboxyvinyltransferase